MLFIVMLTGRCNLKCLYCGGTIEKSVMPHDVTYNPGDLFDFLNSFRNVSVAFYGGEPLLRDDLIREIMDSVRAKHFIIQTNGLLLNRLEKEYIRRFSTILVSVDGVREVTDYYRNGTYNATIESVRKISEFFDGELIARMTASQKTDIYRDVMHILKLDIFTHVHWQIDAVWSNQGVWRDFDGWMLDYSSGVSRLTDRFIYELKNGKVLRIVPFLGVLKAMLFESNSPPPCESGRESFAVTTDGRIVACPVVADLEWNWCGDIWNGISRKVEIIDPCPSCRYFRICGGRCLVSNREWFWGEKGFRDLCSLTAHLIESMKRVKKVALELHDQGMIDIRELYYPRFNNTTEIIP